MRLIDADAFKAKFCGTHEFMKRVIDDEPTVDPVKHGRWIHYDSQCTDECSACGATWEIYEHCVEMQFAYCPACGAKMDLQEVTA